MKRKYLLVLPLMFVCCLLFSTKAFAASDSDIQIHVASPIDSLTNESGVVAVEQFPAEIPISVTASTGALTEIKLEYGGGGRMIPPDYTLAVESKEKCGPYTITAKTDQGAIMTVTVNVVFQVRATYDTRYRTIGMNVTRIYEGDTLLKSFPEPQRIDLVNANTVADYEQERIAAWIGRQDGGTYTLKGSLVVKIHNISTGEVYGIYDTNTDFEALTTHYGWTKKALVAFETMRNTALSYQAPVKIDIDATWCDESKKEVYGTLTAQDKGVPILLYPYQTTSVTFAKDDIPLSRNFIYCGLEWNYTPESTEYTDGESKTQTSIIQKINYKIPMTNFYFKFKACDGNDLSVAIRAPATVYRGDSYSFTVIYMNSGKSPAYDVSLKGTVDSVLIKEIPAIQDFSPNESKTYTIKRTADTKADVIHLWANIGVPDGFIDANLSNNTAMADIRVIDKPAPKPTNPPGPKDNPDNPVPPDDKPEPKKMCNLSASILAPPTVYEHETYSFTVSFTNSSDKELTNVMLQGTNNDSALEQIPKTCSFKPQETKSFTITDKAGNKGEVYRLWANIGVPEGFIDENPSNNTATSKITVIERTPNKPTNPDNPPDKPDKPPKEPDKPPVNPDKPPVNPDKPPVNPDKPPVNPDVPKGKLCDLWVNISSPPTIYEQEEYSFTVYFTNDTDKAVTGANLSTTVDNTAVKEVTSTASFEAHETKTFVVKGKAGEKGTTIKLRSAISPPQEYTDTTLSNNTSDAEIPVMERPYDLDVQRITPDQYKKNQTVISTIKVSNKGSKDFTPGQKVSVLFEIPELSLKKRVDAMVMEQNTWNVVSVRWDTPNVQADKYITLIATINPDRNLNNETSFANNTYTQKAVIKNVTYDEPEESRTLPDPPQRKEQPRVTWWEQRYENGKFVWHEYYAELKVSAELDYATKGKGYLKSGYGYSIKVIASVSTNYDRPELITAPQTAEVYLPEYRYNTAIPLVKEDGLFVFKENPASPFKYRKQYVPIWFPDDKDYTVQLLVTDVHTPGGTLSRWITGGQLAIPVMDSMYSDDVTGGDW
ncbi:hypothetical protein SAMN02745975_01514 [Geosporobacter subterraneus DSM 17957]|uniref:CARDB protein n=1 Tax=Geosporobacter subterraneus DSM 17957 TaxID=1121919 RepID=A0A1M6HDL6_9FIRM|nr:MULTISPECIES: hypothetical protein [Clostridia]SHJ20291.1 hypothetical protein SAMN02745975_01514 [Geosporobacter subterraneus DSM 17957]